MSFCNAGSHTKDKKYTAQTTMERVCKTVLIKVTELSTSAKYLMGL